MSRVAPVLRTRSQRLKDLLTFPLRALTLFHDDRWGLSSLASERFDYVAAEVQGVCLDIGCGYGNRFIRDILKGNGIGIDVFPYEGLARENIVKDLTHLPFPDASFDSVTFIANINHAPRSQRDAELAEAFRVLRDGGNILLTMGLPVIEVMVHKVVWAYDRFLGTRVDMDSERGMQEGEDYYLTDAEIRERLGRAGFGRIERKPFRTQWGMNRLYIGWKE
jgi:ubiquinone/menaquinone biosynthesis C-methylase UbiE